MNALPSRDLATVELDQLVRFTRQAGPDIDEVLRVSVSDLAGGPLGPVALVARQSLGIHGSAGRRWRPLLTAAVARAVSGSYEQALEAAVAVEMTHTASLVLDDLPCMDNTEERRGRPATHRSVGTAGAILLAVGFLGRAAELLGRSGPRGGELAEEWGRTFGFLGMAGGQAVDLSVGGACTGSARRLYRKKTTALVSLAATAGGYTSGASDRLLADLRAFGDDVGWAYQLLDDAADLTEDQARGKAVGGRNPVRQAQRLLDRGVARIRRAPDLDVAGRDLLEGLARRVICRTPRGVPVKAEEMRLC